MTAVTFASTPEDAAAVTAIRAHHAELAEQLTFRIALLLDAVNTSGPIAAEARSRVVSFCEEELLPHAAAEEETLYATAAADPRATLLIDAMRDEHVRLGAQVTAIRDAETMTAAVSEARGLQVLFDAHVAKENDLVVPLLATSPDVSLTEALDGMHELTGSGGHDHHHENDHGHRNGHGHENGAVLAGSLGETAPHSSGETAPHGSPDSPGPLDRPEQAAAPHHGGGGCGCGNRDAVDAPPELDVRLIPHALRHAAVFGAVDGLAPGASMVLVAPHDPVPLLHQLRRRNPEGLEIDYRMTGPLEWRLLLTRR
ncbi:MAG: DUF2249 domain-containing protein [Actinomycetales bacterium]|nr:DUF2249 domain-containing protein [Actinomycetales bacterium]